MCEGTKPEIQDIEYWNKSGYKHIAFENDGAITLSKKEIKLQYHCQYVGFSPSKPLTGEI